MGQSHSAVGRVDRLAARPRGAEHVDAQIALGDLDLDRFVQQGDDLDRREAGLALAGRVERTHAHQPVRAGLDAERAERVRRVDLEGRRLDAGLFGVRRVHDRDRVLVLLGPPQIHAQQHLGEVGRVHSPGAGADRDHGRALVVFAVQQRLHFELADDVLEFGELVTRLFGGILVVHLIGELDHDLEIVKAPLDAADAGELGLTVAQRTRDLLRLLGVVPQVGHTCGLTQTGDLGGERIDVDDRLDVGERGAQRLNIGGQIEIKHDSPD